MPRVGEVITTEFVVLSVSKHAAVHIALIHSLIIRYSVHTWNVLQPDTGEFQRFWDTTNHGVPTSAKRKRKTNARSAISGLMTLYTQVGMGWGVKKLLEVGTAEKQSFGIRENNDVEMYWKGNADKSNHRPLDVGRHWHKYGVITIQQMDWADMW